MSDDSLSPRWSRTTKLIVALTAVAVVAWVLWRFNFLIAPLVSAAMIAYLLNPLISVLSGRLKLSRTLVAALLYLLLLTVLIASVTGLSVYIFRQIAGLNLNIQQIVKDLPERIDELIHSQLNILGYTIDLNQLDLGALYSQIANAVQPALSRIGTVAGQAASGTAEFFGWSVFVLIISFYIVKDMPSFVGMIERYATDPGYQHDVARLMREFEKVWNAFLRGQLTLGLTIGVVTWVGLSILNVRYALVLALLAGLLEFVPTLGPIVAAIVAVGVALFQDSNWFGIAPLPYAIIVAVFAFLVQQVENNFLVPRIIGEHLDLHPVIIMVGAIMGASIGGILGLLLAAPVLATFKLFGRYAWRKMLDLPPFPEPESHEHKPVLALPRINLKAWFNRPGPKKPVDTEKNP
jgi:predicted PurR-regulated permease PerM